MKSFSRSFAVFLILAVFSNGLLAAHMAAAMAAEPMQASVEMAQDRPCHGDTPAGISSDAGQPASGCCEGDCSSCVSTSSAVGADCLSLAVLSSLTLSLKVNNHLLPAHRANLFKPPILL
ncbi:hypothetical protein [Candidatus Pelagadaptatus aseana]|uniref:hypothetical protein n=1 Tax=Candidatus Pelagadaptatus aseana TaxID=3120508 RepID=UPI003C6FDC6E